MIRAQALPVVGDEISTIAHLISDVIVDEKNGVYYILGANVFSVYQLTDDSLVDSTDLTSYTTYALNSLGYSEKYNKFFIGRAGVGDGDIIVLDGTDYSVDSVVNVGSRSAVLAVVDELDYMLVGTSGSTVERYTITTVTEIASSDFNLPSIGIGRGLYDKKYGYVYLQADYKVYVYKKDYYLTGTTPLKEFTIDDSHSHLLFVGDLIVLTDTKTYAINRMTASMLKQSTTNDIEIEAVAYSTSQQVFYARTNDPVIYRKRQLTKVFR